LPGIGAPATALREIVEQNVASPEQPVPASRAVDADHLDLIQYAAVLWKWRKVIAAGTLAAAAMALLTSFAVPKAYEATATMVVLAPRFRESQMTGSLDLEEARMAKSYEGVVKSIGALVETIDEFKLQEPPFDLTLEKFEDKVSVRATKDTNILSITVELPDREVAAQVANSLSQRAVDQKRRLGEASMERSRTFMETEVARALVALEKAELELKRFGLDNPMEVLRADLETRLAQRGDLEQKRSLASVELARATGDREDYERTLAKLQRTLTTTRSLVDDPSYQQALAKSASADTKSMLALSMRAEELNPTYTVVETHVAETRSRENGLRAQLAEVARLLDENAVALDLLRRDLIEKETQQAVFSRAHDMARDTYAKMSTALNATSVEVVSKTGELAIVDPARPCEQPVRPKKLINTMVGGGLGFLISIMVAFLSEYLQKAGGLERLMRDRT
jgi:polysaccharide biosynthesis transport protein